MLTAQISNKKLIREMGSSDLLSHFSTLNDENDTDGKLRNLCVRCYRQITGTDLKWKLLVDRVELSSGFSKPDFKVSTIDDGVCIHGGFIDDITYEIAH